MAHRAAHSPGDETQARVRSRAADWARASCAEQGVALKVTDPVVLAQVAQLLTPPRPAKPPRRANRRTG